MNDSTPRTILVGYDGSAGADAAVDGAARLFGGSAVIVASVWWSVRHAASAGRAALPDDVVDLAVTNLDGAARDEAEAVAARGVERARAAGLEHLRVAVAPAEPSVWAALLRLAEDHDVAAVVVGSRGRSGVRAAVLGSVSTAVVHHCRRPVVVIHPPEAQAVTAEVEPGALR